MVELPKDEGYCTGLSQHLRALNVENLDVVSLTGRLRAKESKIADFVGPVSLIRVSFSPEHAAVVNKAILDFGNGKATKKENPKKK